MSGMPYAPTPLLLPPLLGDLLGQQQFGNYGNYLQNMSCLGQFQGVPTSPEELHRIAAAQADAARLQAEADKRRRAENAKRWAAESIDRAGKLIERVAFWRGVYSTPVIGSFAGFKLKRLAKAIEVELDAAEGYDQAAVTIAAD